MQSSERLLYLAHASLPIFRQRIILANSVIKAGLEKMQRPYISMSFGKDSTVMTHLLLQAIPDAPVIYVNCGEFDEWPDTPRVRDEFLRRVHCNFHEIVAPSIFDLYITAGYVLTDYETGSKAARQMWRIYDDSLGKAITTRAKELGCDGGFLGLRAAESINRTRLFNWKENPYYAESRKMWTCCPLEKWTARDVWAYITKNDLPYNDLYDRLPCGREKARNGTMMWMGFIGNDRSSTIKQFYPDIWNRFICQFPEIAREL